MKKLSTLLTLHILLITACTFNVEVLTPEPLPSETLTPAGSIVTAPTASATVAASTSTTPIQNLPAAQFSNARFTVDVSGNIYQNIFPARTRSVYAVWDYQNMRAGMMIRRDWYYNDVLWITREEPWDFSKYGANGSISDISVYDLDIGLQSGKYRLELYIDMQPQPIGEFEWPAFMVVNATSEMRVTSPNGQWVAEADDPRKLLVRDTGKNVRELFIGNEITNLTWLPDSQHVLFLDRDRARQETAFGVGIRDDLWIIEIVSGQSNLLYTHTTSMGRLVVSPDSHYIASMEGSGFADACFVDSKLIFFELAGDLRSATSMKQEQFSGVPEAPDSSVYPVEAGTWQSDTEYLVTLDGTCIIDQNLMGAYLFDVQGLSAKKSRE